MECQVFGSPKKNAQLSYRFMMHPTAVQNKTAEDLGAENKTAEG